MPTWLLCLDSIPVSLEFQVKRLLLLVLYWIGRLMYHLLLLWNHQMDFIMTQLAELNYLSLPRNGDKWEYISVKHFYTSNLINLLNLEESSLKNCKEVKNSFLNIIQMMISLKEKVIQNQKQKIWLKRNSNKLKIALKVKLRILNVASNKSLLANKLL